MSSLDQRIHEAFALDHDFSGLVTGGFFWIQLPQNPSYPCGAFQRISAVPLYTQNPTGQGRVGRARYQFTFWSQSSDAASELDAIYQATLAVLNTFNGYALPASPAVHNQAPSFVLNRRDTVEPQVQPPAFKTILDVSLWYQDQ